MNRSDPPPARRDAWPALARAAATHRRRIPEPDTDAPLGFATRVVALWSERRRRLARWERWSLRSALGAAAAAAILAVTTTGHPPHAPHSPATAVILVPIPDLDIPTP